MVTAWRLLVDQRSVEAYSEENARLVAQAGKRAHSIWHKNKEELVELAVQELGMSRRNAKAETVTVLREKLRVNRQVMAEEQDPMAKIPKGLEKMLHAQLMVECVNRGISVEPLPGHTRVITRAQMIIRIRDDVERRFFKLDNGSDSDGNGSIVNLTDAETEFCPKTSSTTAGGRVAGRGRDGRIMNNSLFRWAASTVTEAGGRAKTLLSRVMHTERGLPRSDLVSKDDFDGITAGMSSYVVETKNATAFITGSEWKTTVWRETRDMKTGELF